MATFDEEEATTPPLPAEHRDEGSHTLYAWGAVAAALLIAVALGTVIVVKIRRKPVAEETPPPSKDVVVRRIAPRDLVDDIRLPGTVEPWESVWVTAQIAGEVISLEVDEGRKVERGDALCRLDERDYKAAADRAAGVVAQGSAALRLAKLQLDRIERLKNEGAIGEAELDAADAAAKQAEAALAQATAAREQASLALQRTVVRSPLTGVVSEVPVTVGTVLAPGKKVARIVDSRKVRVAVGIPERDVLAVRTI
ncbi:MAG: efflux RND transporter periplasmic adaptor subunit, partial [Planctomycetota bacterium]